MRVTLTSAVMVLASIVALAWLATWLPGWIGVRFRRTIPQTRRDEASPVVRAKRPSKPPGVGTPPP